MFHPNGAGAGGRPPVKKPVIRREIVQVPAKKPPAANGTPKPAQPLSRPPANRFQLSETAGQKRKSAAPLPKKIQAPHQRAIAASRGVKRKSTTPDRVIFSSESEDESSELGGSDSDVSRKRIKSSEPSSVDSKGPKREIVLEAAFEDTTPLDILHGADCTSGDQINKFKNPWEQESFETVELQYPSNSERERFELKWPKNEKDDYKPMEDITETIKQVATFYFPDDLSDEYTDDGTGFGRKFTRAWLRHSIQDFKDVVENFNSVLTPLVKDGTIKRHLAKKRSVPLDLVRRITDQIYSRTVSPKVETLRDYQNGTDYVYGELLSRFCSDIFRRINLTADQVFVDLGSGVGNVVLQAALEIGCESWGIEKMKNPCDLADLQQKEFPGRCQLWGLSAGSVHLIRGDFTTNPEIDAVLQRADVVLVNNQAFTPELNDKLRDKFLDLKTGCKVVSLRPFVPEHHKINARNAGSVVNQFVQKKFEYFSGSVSWTDQSGHYYVAVKDPRPLAKFMESQRPRS